MQLHFKFSLLLCVCVRNSSSESANAAPKAARKAASRQIGTDPSGGSCCDSLDAGGLVAYVLYLYTFLQKISKA